MPNPNESPNEFSSIDQAVEAIAAGGPVIVVDDSDPDNAGDFICAAEKVTPEIVNQMSSGGCGQLFVALLPDRAATLDLEPLTRQGPSSPSRANVTIAVDLESTASGVSATDRAATIRALAAPETRPSDLRRPGNIHPLIAREGGVLRRARHTESAVDLVRLAGLRPAGVLTQILDDAGDVARRCHLVALARRHDIPIVTIRDLLRYRRRHEKLVERAVETVVPTAPYGDLLLIGYRVRHEGQEPLAIVKGDLTSIDNPLVRMHSSCFTGDVLGSLRCECGDQLQMALARITAEGAGAVIYLPQEGRGIGLLAKLEAYVLQDSGRDTVEANHDLGFPTDMRDYGVGIQILKDLGLSRIRLLTNNPKKLDAFIYYGYDLEVVGQEPLIVPTNVHNERYLATKRDKLGHRLPGGSDAPMKKKAGEGD